MFSQKPDRAVRIVEVGPRDGLQNISSIVPLNIKLELIKRLERTGLNTIELTSAVSPRSIPQLADCRKLLRDSTIQSLLSNDALRLPVLVPNLKGLQVAIEHNVREVAVFVSASEGFSKANINCSVQQGLDRARMVAREALAHGIATRGYVSCIFACPYDGDTTHSAVLNCVQQLLDMGCYEISLGDTLGVGVAPKVKALLNFLVRSNIPVTKIAGHFHDTYGQAVSNVQAAYDCGVRVFDSSVAGLGGCPFAPGAKGNVATEDLVYMFHQADIPTGVDLSALVATGVWISQQLLRQNESRAGNALAAKGKPSIPPTLKNKPSNTSAAPTLTWTPLQSSESLQFHQSGPNVKITLNRPRNGNALTTPMISELIDFFQKAAIEPKITRIAIAARGKFFCTGMDLARDSTPVARKGSTASTEQFDRLTRLFTAIDEAPQVTIACIQGPAFGGGVGLAFACDIRIATKAASMTLSEVKLGLCPATISKYVLREWGVAFGRQAMLSGRSVTIEELARLGIVVSNLADSEVELASMLDEYMAGLKVAAPRASTMCKTLARLSWEHAGGVKQTEGIRELFDEMMGEGAEAAYGIKQFQTGNKAIDWDRYIANKFGAKL